MCCEELQNQLEANNADECFSNSSSAKERGKKFIFDNRSGKTVCRVKVDNCLIASTNFKKCDFLFKVCELDKYYLVELKGGGIDDAIKQIVSTYDIVNAKIKAVSGNYIGIIVSSSVPSGTEQKFRKLQEKYLKSKGFLISKTHIKHRSEERRVGK